MKECVRVAREEDLVSVVALVRDVIGGMRAQGIDQWDEVYPDAATLSGDIQRGELLVVDEGGAVGACLVLNATQEAGYAAVPWRYRDEPVAVIHRLMVAPRWQGRGVAHALLAFAERRAREQRFRTVRLDAFTANPRALAFYDRVGYERAGTVRFRKGEFFCFEKKLACASPEE